MKKILLIEDNPDIRENMGEILELAHYEVHLAENGKIGAELALKVLPDLIVCDIMMPVLDGYGVHHLLQQHPQTRNTPFIFLTAKAERQDLRKAMELGVDDYITKPFEGAELLRAISVRLAKKALGSPAQPETPGLEEVFKDQGEEQDFAKKQVIYAERHQPYRLYRIVNGKVKTYRTAEDGKELITGIHGPGEFLGHAAILSGASYQDSAAALEETTLESIPREVFLQLLESHPESTRDFATLLAAQVSGGEERLLGMAYHSLRKKVAEALLKIHEKYQSEAGRPVSFRLSRENLAALAGTAKESLIRTLGEFRDEELIQINGTEVSILNEAGLRRMMN